MPTYTDKNVQAALHAVKQVASEAGDASGNADRAAFIMENSPGAKELEKVIEALYWAKDQSRQADAKASIAIKQVKALMTPSDISNQVGLS